MTLSVKHTKRELPEFTFLKSRSYVHRHNQWKPNFKKYLEFMNRDVGIIKDQHMVRVLEHLTLDSRASKELRNMVQENLNICDDAYARSKYEFPKLFEALKNYDGPSTWNLSSEDRKIMGRVVYDIKRQFSNLRGPNGKGTLQPFSHSEVLDGLKKQKSAGAPFYTQKELVLAESLEFARDIASGKMAPMPDTAYYRTQCAIKEGGDAKSKVRLVWGRSTPVLILEGMYAAPIVEALKSGNYPLTLGLSRIELGVRTSSFLRFKTVGSFDWSRFDSTIPSQLVNTAFEIMRQWFTEVDDRVWRLLTTYMVTSPIIMPDGKVYSGRRRGIASGSWFTNIVGGLCNLILITFLLRKQGIYPDDVIVHGDDSLVGCDTTINLKTLTSDALECFGMILSEDKLSYSSTARHEGVRFLGHTWKRARITRPMSETIQRLVFLERYDRNLADNRKDRVISMYADNKDAYDLVMYLARVSHWTDVPSNWGVINRDRMISTRMKAKDYSGIGRHEDKLDSYIRSLVNATFT